MTNGSHLISSVWKFLSAVALRLILAGEQQTKRVIKGTEQSLSSWVCCSVLLNHCFFFFFFLIYLLYLPNPLISETLPSKFSHKECEWPVLVIILIQFPSGRKEISSACYQCNKIYRSCMLLSCWKCKIFMVVKTDPDIQLLPWGRKYSVSDFSTLFLYLLA